MKWYIAGPLFNEMETVRNLDMASLVESFGFEVYLPQRDGGVFSEMVLSGKNITEIRKSIFDNDMRALQECDGALFLLDGRVLDEGMCVELGVAHILGKKCIAYLTDTRVSEVTGMNIMVEGALEKTFSNKEDMKTCFLSCV